MARSWRGSRLRGARPVACACRRWARRRAPRPIAPRRHRPQRRPRAAAGAGRGRRARAPRPRWSRGPRSWRTRQRAAAWRPRPGRAAVRNCAPWPPAQRACRPCAWRARARHRRRQSGLAHRPARVSIGTPSPLQGRACHVRRRWVEGDRPELLPRLKLARGDRRVLGHLNLKGPGHLHAGLGQGGAHGGRVRQRRRAAEDDLQRHRCRLGRLAGGWQRPPDTLQVWPCVQRRVAV